MNRLVLPAILAGFFVSGCASQVGVVGPVSSAPICSNPRMDWASEVQRLNLGEPVPLSPQHRRRFLAGYNTMPPPSNYTAKEIYLLVLPDVVMAYFVDEPCITHLDAVALPLAQAWLSGRSA